MSTTQAAVATDRFELLYKSTQYVTVPDEATIVALCKRGDWSGIRDVMPSVRFTAGMRKKIKVVRVKEKVSSQDCIDFIGTQNGQLPNVFGLAIAEMTVGPDLPKNVWILGFDHQHKLAAPQYNIKRVAYLVSSDTGIRHDWDECGRGLHVGECFLFFCD